MTSPSPRSSIRARMGHAIRRTSSILSVARPSTPSVHADSASAKSVDAPSQLVLPSNPPSTDNNNHTAPSPIAESPVREAAETQAAALGPSPLHTAVVHDEPEDMQPHEVTTTADVNEAKPVTEDSKADSVHVEFDRPPQEADKVSISTQVNFEEVAPEPVKVEEPVSEAASILSPPPPPAPDAMAEASSYFEQRPAPEEVDEITSSQTTPRQLYEPETIQSFSAVTQPEQPPAEPVPVTMPVYDVPAASVWGGSYQSTNGSTDFYGKTASSNGDVQHDRESVRMPVEDPFADPVPPIVVTTEEEHRQEMPQPQVIEPERQEATAPVVLMPLPPMQDVIAQRSIRGEPSLQSFSRDAYNTDENQPLLSRPAVSYLDSHNPTRVNVSPLSATQNTAVWVVPTPSVAPRLHELGWIEYVLPDTSVYYVHPTLRGTTDIDLRNAKKLGIVTSYFERYKDGAPVGLELWLCEKVDNKRRDTALVEWWVDHAKRHVSSEQPRDGRLRVKGADDALDLEYRYWSFMESHPAHVAIPTHVREEAMDVLTWAWTERLLPSQRALPAPFSQDECQEIMALLRSFGENQGASNGTQSVIQNRLIARILLRLIQWRQVNFRPNKALPKLPAGNAPSTPTPRNTMRRAMVDFIISCVCLGIPYLFYNRSHLRRIDEEHGMRGGNGAGSMLIVGACTCLVAAIVLSASVTFLSLPGLDNVARVAGLIAVLFSTFSMASTVVALFKYKADAERAVSLVGTEGLLIISRRHIVFSLPLVFLSYAVIGFVTGLVLYSFRGTISGGIGVGEQRFQEYTSWAVVGVLGALLGVLTTSVFLMRR